MERRKHSNLPLPISQLMRRASNAKTPLERHLGAFYLFEATVKLLASTAIVEYAATGDRDEHITSRLKSLARPSLGHWWEFTRLLVPVLAKRGDSGFAAVNELLRKQRRHDLPLAAGLDGLLKEVLSGTRAAQSTVRVPNLFDRLVQYRNQQMGHGAAAQKSSDYHDRVGRALLSGLREILRELDVTAGRQIIYIDEVQRLSSGAWSVDGVLLNGAIAERLPTREIPDGDARNLPRPKKVYAAPPSGQSGTGSTLRLLHPFVTYDADSEESFFLNGRKGRAEAEYLCYSSGRILRADLESDQREFMSRILGTSVSSESMNQWAVASLAEESPDKGTTDDSEPDEMVGEFELISRIGRGGMGVVYRAVQPSLSREVALKCLLQTGDERAEVRFAREIRALGRVDHPNLVKIYTSGADGDRWYYAMELVDGVDLSRVLQRLSQTSTDSLGETQWQQAVSTAYSSARTDEQPLGRNPVQDLAPREEPIPPADFYLIDDSRAIDQIGDGGQEYVNRVVDIVRQIALAAHALHAHGVLHRDIKPGNIMLLSDGRRAILMDLGLAKLLDEADGQLTRTRQFVGTLRYASPEQVFAAGNIDARSDIYSLGVTLWELLTLRPIYAATDETPIPELMNRIQFQEPERANRYNRSVSANLEAVVEKCLNKNPNSRYASAKELADDLARILEERPVAAESIDLPNRAVKVLRRYRKVALIVSGVVVLQLLLMWGLWSWWSYKSGEEEPKLDSGGTSRLADIPGESGSETDSEEGSDPSPTGDGTRDDVAPPVPAVETTPEIRVETGRLESADTKLKEGEFSDRHQFYALEGDRVTVDLTSDDFDPYVFVRNGDPDFELDNDDFEGSTSRSRLEFAAPRTGYYTVFVTSFTAGDTGAYELTMTGTSVAPTTAQSVSRRETGELAKGDEKLESGEYVDIYEFEGIEGQAASIRLTSDDFDPYLILVGPLEQTEENDDLGRDRSVSGLDCQLRESGVFRVVVTSYRAGESGRYALNIDVN